MAPCLEYKYTCIIRNLLQIECCKRFLLLSYLAEGKSIPAHYMRDWLLTNKRSKTSNALLLLLVNELLYLILRLISLIKMETSTNRAASITLGISGAVYLHDPTTIIG